MKIWIDADGCPVVDIAVSIAKKYQLEVHIVKNINHHYESDYAIIHTVDTGADQADFFIANRILSKDIAITQDYGLAAMVLAKGAFVMNQFGSVIDNNNIDLHLERRHINREIRKQGGKGTKFKKRTTEDNRRFEEALEILVKRHIATPTS